MLETDEVDDDYFTPVQSTSLANIFGNVSQTLEHEENESLKYTPPKPNAEQKLNNAKSTECIFACAVVGHEWLNGTYASKGKLGLAIVKNLKLDSNNIVLYDSNKTTLSCASATPELEITVSSNHILYYDNLKKYWCVYTTQDKINKITESLQDSNVVFKYDYLKDCSSRSIGENRDETDMSDKNIKYIGSDTDSSVTRKTKTILNRMAMMGHSVLPPQTNVIDKTSESSDTDDSPIQTKVVRHKPIKNVIKRNYIEKNTVLSEPQKVIGNQKRLIVQKREVSDQNTIYTNVDGILMPMESSGHMNKTGNELDIYMTEQRLSNSELRINLNRVNDKIDHMTEKIKNLEHNIYSPSNFQLETLQKLISEYENKIKTYEDYFKSMGVKGVFLPQKDSETLRSHDEDRITKMENKIEELEQIIIDKDSEISQLQNEIQNLSVKVNQHSITTEKNADLLKKITNMEETLAFKNEEFSQILNKFQSLQSRSDYREQNLKDIMNETFSNLATNFDNAESYKGDTIKKIIASVIRRVTIDSLNSS